MRRLGNAPDGCALTRLVARRAACYVGGAMKIPVTLERDETGMIVAECPSIPGCVSQGRTEAEALANIREAVIGCLEVRAQEGMPLSVRTVEIEVAVA